MLFVYVATPLTLYKEVYTWNKISKTLSRKKHQNKMLFSRIVKIVNAAQFLIKYSPELNINNILFDNFQSEEQ